MYDRKPIGTSLALRWVLFLLLLTVAMGWAVRSVLARATMMKTADTPAQALSASEPGTRIRVVVSIDQVVGGNLKATALERVSAALYRRPRAGGVVSAVLTPETSVVMGKTQDIVPGAIVQLAGTLDSNHTLRTSKVVILTGYVHVADDSK